MDLSEDGYEDSRFRGDVGKNLHCLICSKVLKDPVQCRRKQHFFCTPCISRHLKRSHTCPICLEQLTPDTLEHPPRIIADLLSSLKITCDYAQRGCREVVELGVLKRHVKHCKFAYRTVSLKFVVKFSKLRFSACMFVLIELDLNLNFFLLKTYYFGPRRRAIIFKM